MALRILKPQFDNFDKMSSFGVVRSSGARSDEAPQRIPETPYAHSPTSSSRPSPSRSRPRGSPTAKIAGWDLRRLDLDDGVLKEIAGRHPTIVDCPWHSQSASLDFQMWANQRCSTPSPTTKCWRPTIPSRPSNPTGAPPGQWDACKGPGEDARRFTVPVSAIHGQTVQIPSEMPLECLVG